MKRIWQTVNALLGICGFACLFLATSTSDYFVVELGVEEPSYIRTMLIVGFLMVIPAIASAIYYETNGSKSEE